MRTNLLVGAAAVAALITGAIAQTSSHIERIKDPAAQQKAGRESESRGATSTAQNTGPNHVSTEPKKNVRTVYPNTQNAEQAVKQSRGARGQADAMKPGDVTPLSTAQPPAAEPASSAAQPAQSPQPTVQATGPQPSAPATPPSTAQSTPPSSPSTTQSTQAATPPEPAPAVQQPSTPSAQPSTVTSTQQATPTGAAETNTSTSSEPQSSPASRQGSTGIVSLNTEQQTSIGQTIARHNVKPVSNVSFSIAVGTKVPTPVQLRALPSDLTTFIPQYRGYSYFVVEEQIVIVDPGAHEIVAIVPYTGSTATAQTLETPASKPRETVEASTPKPRHVKETSKPKLRSIVQKPMTTRSVNLNTEEKTVTPRHASEPRATTEKSVTPRPATEQKRTTRTVSKREYREREGAPRTVTIEELQEPPVYRAAPRRGGFFGLFRSNDDDDDY